MCNIVSAQDKTYPPLQNTAIVNDVSNRSYKGYDDDAYINHCAAQQAKSTLFVIDKKRILPLTQETMKEVRALNIKEQSFATDSSSATGVTTIVWITTEAKKE